MKKISLNIAGFCLDVIFYPCSIPQHKKKLQTAINNCFKDFIVPKKLQKTDYTIHIKESHLVVTKHISFKKNWLTLLFTENKNSVTTFYYISTQQFVSIVSMIIEKLLLDKGFALHSSSCVVNGKAVLFLGESGAGKSTIINLLKSKYKIIADDAVIIRKIQSGFFVYQAFIIYKNTWIPKKYTSYPLGPIFFLKKAEHFRTKKITAKELVLTQFSKQIWVEKRLSTNKIRMAMDLIDKKNDFYFLYFNKNPKEAMAFFSNLSQNILHFNLDNSEQCSEFQSHTRLQYTPMDHTMPVDHQNCP